MLSAGTRRNGSGGNNPLVSEQEYPDDKKRAEIQEDGDKITETNPIGLSDVDAGTNYADKHQEDSRRVDALPDGSERNERGGWAKDQERLSPKRLQPEQCHGRGDEGRDGIETRNLSRLALHILLNSFFNGGMDLLLKVLLIPRIRLMRKMLFNEREDDSNRRELEN